MSWYIVSCDIHAFAWKRYGNKFMTWHEHYLRI